MNIIQTIPMFISSKITDTTQNGSSYSLRLSQSIELPTDKTTIKYYWETIRSNVWWTIPNFQNTDAIHFTSGASVYVFQFQKGLYSIAAINENLSHFFIKEGLLPNLFYFTGDSAENKLSIHFDGPCNVLFDSSPASTQTRFGFSYDVTGVRNEVYQGDNIANLNTVTSIYINSDFTHGTVFNNRLSSTVIEQITPSNVSPGELIIHDPRHLIQVEISSSRLDQMTFWLTDQNGNYIDTNGEIFEILGRIIIVTV